MSEMNRRDFVRFLATVAAGASALPQSIEAFTRYYEVNTPQIATGLVSIDEIVIGGVAQHSLPARCRFGDLRFGINLFGGMCRWVAAPDHKIIVEAKKFTWDIKSHSSIAVLPNDIEGQISFVDQSAKRYYREITINGSLA